MQKKNSSYENAECGRMARIKEIADAADMIVSGYAFTRLPDGYRVINLYNGPLVKTTLEEIIVNTF